MEKYAWSQSPDEPISLAKIFSQDYPITGSSSVETRGEDLRVMVYI